MLVGREQREFVNSSRIAGTRLLPEVSDGAAAYWQLVRDLLNADSLDLSRFRFRGRAITTLFIALIGLASAGGQNLPRTVHVFVALADNLNQGIVPVPARLGNGEDAEHNLYWGAAAGVKTFFARSADWTLISQHQRPKPEVLERCIFKHKTANVYLVADAYQGNKIRQTIADFLAAAAGSTPQKIPIGTAQNSALSAGGGADLVVYIGHDGFMDFQLESLPQSSGPRPREAIVLACLSKSYFAAPLRAAGAQPLLWTTGLMAPEAYTLKSALDGWVMRENSGQIRERAAAAYDKYQKCGVKGARRLLVSGW